MCQPDSHLDDLAELMLSGGQIEETDLWDGYAYEDLNFNDPIEDLDWDDEDEE